MMAFLFGMVLGAVIGLVTCALMDDFGGITVAAA